MKGLGTDQFLKKLVLHCWKSETQKVGFYQLI